MTVPVYSSDDYARAMASLLPRGPAWPRDAGSSLIALMGALAPTYQRSNASASALLPDVSPATTYNFLAEWEETLGLPDPCTPLNPSTAQRRAAILAKFIGSGGQSAPYMISVAAALGYAVTITEYSTFRLGVSTLGFPLCGPGWESVWQVNAPTITVSYFQLGIGVLGDPFWATGNTQLECRLNAIKPAHTKLIFKYS